VVTMVCHLECSFSIKRLTFLRKMNRAAMSEMDRVPHEVIFVAAETHELEVLLLMVVTVSTIGMHRL
jgi:hypothetical protein